MCEAHVSSLFRGRFGACPVAVLGTILGPKNGVPGRTLFWAPVIYFLIGECQKMDPKMDPGLLPEAAPRLIFFFATKAFPGWSKQTCLLRQRLEPNWFKADLRLSFSLHKDFLSCECCRNDCRSFASSLQGNRFHLFALTQTMALLLCFSSVCGGRDRRFYKRLRS